MRASPLVRDGLAYPNSEPPQFKNVGDLLPVGVANDEAAACSSNSQGGGKARVSGMGAILAPGTCAPLGGVQ